MTEAYSPITQLAPARGSTGRLASLDVFRGLVILTTTFVNYLAAMLLRPLHGIHKVAATESFALITSGICCLASGALNTAALTALILLITWAATRLGVKLKL